LDLAVAKFIAALLMRLVENSVTLCLATGHMKLLQRPRE
jgi:hypothetical protein